MVSILPYASSCQLLIFNLKESFGSEVIKNAADKSSVQQMLYAIGALQAVENLENVSRIGSQQQQSSGENPRPILVKFMAEKDQAEVLTNSSKLKNFPEWKNVAFEAYRTLPLDPEKEAMRKRLEELEKQLDMVLQSRNNETECKQWNSDASQLNSPNAMRSNFDLIASESLQQGFHCVPPVISPYNIFGQHQAMQNSTSKTYDYQDQPIQSPLLATNTFQTVIPQIPNQNIPFDVAAMYQLYLQQQQQQQQLQQHMLSTSSTSSSRSNTAPLFVTPPLQHLSPTTELNASNQNQPLLQPDNFLKQNSNETVLFGPLPPTLQAQQDSPAVAREPTYENNFFNAQAEEHFGPKMTVNILVVGETGVGKSTWINANANYETFNTLEDALAAPSPICLIASKFTFYESHENKILVKVEPSHGEKDENEAFSDQGQSSTQEPKTYQFETSKYIVNIIDTPGIGDTRGIEQDKENTRKILAAIGQYKDLHAICFLFKANEARMTTSFQYCISELLLQLHKDAIDNIFFFFTNSRGTFYKPGDTMTPLTEFLTQLEEKRGLRIALEPKKICCTDNEAFRLVCAAANGAKFTAGDLANFAGSWQHSANETHKFLEFAASQRAHKVADTISVNKARTVILHLAKPLADVNELIESNIKVFNDRKADLKNTATSMDEIKKKIKISKIAIEIKPLDYPKTVCASERCIETVKLPNTEQLQTVYRQICHDHCYLTGVDVEKVPEPNLINCAAMSGQNCQSCECLWSTHMHIRFDQIKTTLEVEDKNAMDMIEKNKSASSIKKQMLKDCEQQITSLKAEQQKIIQISLRFGSFLQANAILPYNDAFEKYVEQSIREEENCIKVGGDPSKLKNLKKCLAEYKQEKCLISKAAKKKGVNDGKAIDPAEIDACKAELFNLPHTGQTLRALFQASEDGIAKNNAHVTVKYKPPTQIKSILQSIFQKSGFKQ